MVTRGPPTNNESAVPVDMTNVVSIPDVRVLKLP